MYINIGFILLAINRKIAHNLNVAHAVCYLKNEMYIDILQLLLL